jgi:hypothetical protein
MAAAIVFLPLLGALIAGFFGRALGDRGSQIVTCGGLILAAVLGVVMFFDVAIGGHGRTVDLLPWINSGTLDISWSLKLDALSATMIVVVTVVSEKEAAALFSRLEEAVATGRGIVNVLQKMVDTFDVSPHLHKLCSSNSAMFVALLTNSLDNTLRCALTLQVISAVHSDPAVLKELVSFADALGKTIVARQIGEKHQQQRAFADLRLVAGQFREAFLPAGIFDGYHAPGLQVG